MSTTVQDFCPYLSVYDVTDCDILALWEKLLIICNMHCWSVTSNWSVQIFHLAQKSSYSYKRIYVVWGQMLPSEHSARNVIQEHWHLHQILFATVMQFTYPGGCQYSYILPGQDHPQCSNR